MENHIHDMMEILMMSLALGMDAFSLALGLGLQGIGRRSAVKLSASIGVFHLVMTLMGIYAGMMLEEHLGKVAQWFGAVLLVGLGVHMVYATLVHKEEQVSISTTGIAMLLFSAGVSIDALSVGFSLGLRSTAYGIVSAVMFGIAGAGLCLFGLFIGKRANRVTGMFGELSGGFILIGYGLHFLFV